MDTLLCGEEPDDKSNLLKMKGLPKTLDLTCVKSVHLHAYVQYYNIHKSTISISLRVWRGAGLGRVINIINMHACFSTCIQHGRLLSSFWVLELDLESNPLPCFLRPEQT